MGLSLARTTRDIDFLGLAPNDIDTIGALIREIGNLPLDDGLVYEVSELDIETMAEDAEYPGIRLKFNAWLGKARIPMQINVGFGDAVVPDAREMTFPTLLDMEPPVVRAYSIETIVAEKFEASLDLSELNSRMKDFYDIWMLSHAYPFHGPTLQQAVAATCERRATPLTSKALIFSKEFAAGDAKKTQWTTFLRKANLSDISDEFPAILEGIRKFLQPLAEVSENRQRFEKEWPAGGPWRS